MVLEATMIVIDSSEYMRNGDYTPSRYQSQLDTVELIFRRKTSSNPESTVGLLSMGGEGGSARVLSNLTNDYGTMLSGMHEAKIAGASNVVNGVQVACLALKNRQNKNQRQRVVVFVGSPITNTDKELEKLAKRLKKNNVAIDFVNFGEEQVNTAKLDTFVANANKDSTSHLVTVPPGPYLLYEQVDKSPILRGQESGGGAGGFGGAVDDFGMGGADDFGLDDQSMDPELALAIRLSLEEERARQERKTKTEDAAEPNLESVAEGQEGEGEGEKEGESKTESKADNSTMDESK